ncbi:hypothetical protein Sste5346_008639 [Sporothrix stenoceras]|uniref:Mitochondrial division protein 1 n=1 Tax=Sporothrix stenoceras TaxID=5173 RepID=A0ABR3YPU7_9PEZI
MLHKHKFYRSNLLPIAGLQPLSQKLWNDAYDHLKKDGDTAKLVEAYEMTLIKVVRAEASASGATDDLAELDDPENRQTYMKMLVQEGKTRISKASKITKGVGDFATLVLSSKGIVDLVVQNFPQAALPWAGVCAGLQILMNPANATKSNLAGIAHVVSRMDWYCALTEHLLDMDKAKIGDESFESVLQQLEETVLTLYKALLLYQMKSVCSYHRNSGLVVLRGLANMDDWDGDLSGVTDAEAAVERLSVQYHREYEKSFLYRLVIQGKDAQILLGDIRKDLRESIAQQQKIQEKGDNRECLRALFAVDPQSDMGTIESKKDDLLDDAYKWILDSKEYAAFTNWSEGESDLSPCRLLWIKGPAGTGKTMLMIGIIRELFGQPSVLTPSLSYFFHQGTGDKALRSATAALRSLIWLLLFQQPHLIFHLRSKYETIGAPLFHDRNAFFALSDVFKSMLKDPHLLPAYFVVDALDECDQGLPELVKLISSSIALSDKVKWLVSSRPEVELENSDTVGSLVELDAQKLKDPVNAYIDHKLSTLRALPGYDKDTLAEVSDEMHRRAENTFLWAALVLKELHSVEGWYAVETIRMMPLGLSDLYEHMMTRIELYLIHQSAKDYLSCKFDKVSPSDLKDAHRAIFSRSLETMSKTLRRDMYGLGAPGFPIEKVQQPTPDPLAVARYSYVYWVDHLRDSSPSEDESCYDDLQEGGTVDSFLRKKYIYWLEALSLLRSMSEGVLAIEKLKNLLNAPLQAYASALVFSPTRSLVRELFKLEEPNWLIRKPVLEAGWNACLQTLEGHDDSVWSVAFSADGNHVASASSDDTVKIWNITSGACLQTLEGHNESVWSVAFSADGNHVASASSDKTVKIWNITSGACLQTLEGHNESVWSVAFSADGNHVASASSDKTVKIWNITSGACLQTPEGHNDWVSSVAFSADGNHVASASIDKTVKIWNITSGACLQTLEGHNDRVSSVAFSADGNHVASASEDKTVKIWNITSGACLQTLEGHNDRVSSVAFSADGNHVASASEDKTVKIWDITSGVCLQTLEGHDDLATSATFSANGNHVASASIDKTVKIWDITSGACLQTLDGHNDRVRSVTFSADGSHVASASDDKTVKIWDTTSGACLQTLEGHNDWVSSVAFSADGNHVASASEDKTVKIWDITSGACLQTLEGHDDLAMSATFSADGNHVASASIDKTVKIWDITSGACLQTLEGHNDLVSSVVFSADGNHVASASEDKTVKIWDTTSGKCIQTINIGPSLFDSLSFDAAGSYLLTEYGRIKVDLSLDLHAIPEAAHVVAFGAPVEGQGLQDRKWYGYGDIVLFALLY